MKTDVKFTEEELLFIENQMDIQASILDNKIHQICEDFMIIQTSRQEDEELKKLVASRIIENGRTGIILKSIRDKIEDARK